MTYDTTATQTTNSRNEWTDWATRPGFHPGKLLAVIAGFAIFPPLGIAALVYFIWASKRAYWRGSADGRAYAGGCGRRSRGTGNDAFDAHRAKVLDELEAERQAFRDFRAEEKAKKDSEEFESFRKAGETKSND